MGKRNDDNYEARKLLSIKYLEHDPALGWIVGKSAFSQFFTLKVVLEENFMQQALSLPLLCSFQTGELSKSLQMITLLPRGGGSGQIISVLHRGGPANDYSIPWFWEEYTLNMIKRQKKKKFLLHVKFVKKYFLGVYDKWLQYYMGALSLGTSK